MTHPQGEPVPASSGTASIPISGSVGVPLSRLGSGPLIGKYPRREFGWKRTVIPSLLGSIAATGAFWLTNTPSWEDLNIPIGSRTAADTNAFISNPLVTSVDSAVSETSARTVRTSTRIEMPDVTSFDLSTTPSAQRLVYSRSLQRFVEATAVKATDNKATSVDCNVTGTASDETRLSRNAGIGRSDSQNQHLAPQYGKFIYERLVSVIRESSAAKKFTAALKPSHESILSAAAVRKFVHLRQQAGFRDNFDLIQTWKTQPSSLSASTRDYLHNTLASFRGAQLSCDIYIPANNDTTPPSSNSQPSGSQSPTISPGATTPPPKSEALPSTPLGGNHRSIPIMLIPLVTWRRRWYLASPARRTFKSYLRNLVFPVYVAPNMVGNSPSGYRQRIAHQIGYRLTDIRHYARVRRNRP